MIRDAGLFFTIILLDRITKALLPRFLELYESVPVIPGFFDITYVRNSGGAFGILSAWDSPLRRVFFILASVAALILLAFLYRQAAEASTVLLRAAVACIGAGAFGNLYDRAFSGEVVDFLDFYLGPYHYPSFNVADIAISLGAATLGYLYITGKTDLVIGTDPDRVGQERNSCD